MISYFYRNKGKNELNICEDSLSAVVFDCLKYLPAKLFWTIVKESLYQDKLPMQSGELIDIIYWDKWSANHPEITNKNYVEPDVFLRFEEFDVIVEAKRYDRRMQNPKQLKEQIIAYLLEFSDENKKLYFIKLGGLHDFTDQENFYYDHIEVPICKTDWTHMLDVISKHYMKIKKKNHIGNASSIRILKDCIDGFALHQFYKKEWLTELKPYKTINHQILKKTFNYGSKLK